MNTVQKKIKNIVEQMNMMYMFGGWSQANVRLDNAVFPIVIDILPVSGAINVKQSMYRDAPNCLLFFADKAEDFDSEAERNQRIVERMKVKAQMFIEKVNESGLFACIEGDVKYQVMYDKFDVCVTGVALSVQLREMVGVCSELLDDKLKELEDGTD